MEVRGRGVFRKQGEVSSALTDKYTLRQKGTSGFSRHLREGKMGDAGKELP